MYEDFFGLTENPFSILPDPKFIYFSKNHLMAMSMLEYGIVNQAGFTVITGAIGSGKTTLVKLLLEQIGSSAKVGVIDFTTPTTGNLLEWVAMAFDLPFEGQTSTALYRQFRDFIQDLGTHKAVLVIDEAQNLGRERLEELRMLSNINSQAMSLQLILVGQPELRTMLRAPKLVQFAQRVTADFHLPVLKAQEAVAYIDHRVAVAGGEKGLFTHEAKVILYTEAKGVPRQINVLADRSLVYAFAQSARHVSGNIVRTVIADRKRHGLFGRP